MITFAFIICVAIILAALQHTNDRDLADAIEHERKRIDELNSQCDVLAAFINEMSQGIEHLHCQWVMSNGKWPALTNNEPVIVIMNDGKQYEGTVDSVHWPHVIAYKVVLS